MASGGVLAATVRTIDRLNETIGRVISWFVLTMVLTTFAVAVMRYGFSLGWVWLQEIYVWMHGTIIMVAAGYTLLHDGHVRVDIFYRSASVRFKAWVDMLGVIFFVLPMVSLVWWAALPYVELSWRRLESSQEAGGMHGLYLLKTAMLVFCILLGLQGIAMAIRSAFVLMKRPSPDDIPDQGQTGM